MLTRELMQYDWVLAPHTPIPQEILEVRTCTLKLRDNTVWPNDRLSPVPLTAEILKLNGFMEDPLSGNREAKVLTRVIRALDLQTVISVEINGDPCYVAVTSRYGSYQGIISHVHEFQHLLYLCHADITVITYEKSF